MTSLVLNGETLDEVSLAGRCRTNAIRMLCHMHPSKSAYVQSLAVSHCKHPTLVLSLALEEEKNRMRLRSCCGGDMHSPFEHTLATHVLSSPLTPTPPLEHVYEVPQYSH